MLSWEVHKQHTQSSTQILFEDCGELFDVGFVPLFVCLYKNKQTNKKHTYFSVPGDKTWVCTTLKILEEGICVVLWTTGESQMRGARRSAPPIVWTAWEAKGASTLTSSTIQKMRKKKHLSVSWWILFL